MITAIQGAIPTSRNEMKLEQMKVQLEQVRIFNAISSLN